MSLTLLSGGATPLPAPPDRWTLMTKRWHFQGLRVPIPEFPPNTGWFEPALAWIPKAQRPLVYQTKDAAGDELYGLSLSGCYRESGQPYAQYAGMDFSKDLPALNALIDEILTGGPGRAIRLFCAGDGQGSGPDYNDPFGMTYGADWLMHFTPTLLASLGPVRRRFIQLYPGYDGIWYGWNPPQFVQWPQLVRAIDPAMVMGFEHSVGIPPFVFNETDWLPGGALDGWDMTSSEYNGQSGSTQCLTHDDAVWQIKGRLRYASTPYNRPTDQPAGDDPNPPPCLGDCSRGPRVHEDMEWSTYEDVRGGCTPQGIDNDRAYLKPMVANSLQG